jgi:hypothetical protein
MPDNRDLNATDQEPKERNLNVIADGTKAGGVLYSIDYDNGRGEFNIRRP